MSLAQRTESVVALAGGVGGAKLAQGLARIVPGDALTIIVNTADDFDLWGLRICPDLDTVMYTLAGLANPVAGWGIAGDSRVTLDALTRLGVDPWFQLGDQDFATHIYRTAALRAGDSLGSVTTRMTQALGIDARVLPMTDDAVATVVETASGPLEFQQYFVARRQEDEVKGITFRGIETATAAPGVLSAIADADVIVLCPSNPFVSIAPILDVPGVRDAVAASTARRIAVSPIVGGKALKGPADRMLTSLSHEVSPIGVARMYRGLIDAMVIDSADAALASRLSELDIEPVVTATVMGDVADRARLANDVLDAARSGAALNVAR